MGNLLRMIDWIEKNEIMDDLLNQEDTLTTHQMDPGFEAEVMKINLDKESYVLKIWNKSSTPDISFQFHLLNHLFERGLSVSKPMGWGVNPQENKVLLTTFDGNPVLKVNEKKLTDIAMILSSIHKIPFEEMGKLKIPKYDFIDYFYPGVGEHPDIYQALHHLVGMTQIKQERLIHGDFHLANIVERNEQFTIIDWTNGQLGDPRYDFAWSLTLKRIYISEHYATVFRTVYLSENQIEQEELEIFEAIACLRWLLLNRKGDTPKTTNTMERVKSIINNNPFLTDYEFIDIPTKEIKWDGDNMNNEAVFEQFPTLESDVLVLKKIENSNLEEVFEIYSNDKVFEYCGIIPKHNKDTIKSMIGHFERDYNKKSRVKWGIFVNNDRNRLVGIIEALDFNQKVNMVTLGYFLSEAHWGKGIAAEAVKLLLHFLFENVNVNRIQAEVMPLNEASKKVLLKNGFIKEGMLRQAAVWSGKGIVDLEIYSILKEDYVNCIV